MYNNLLSNTKINNLIKLNIYIYQTIYIKNNYCSTLKNIGYRCKHCLSFNLSIF